MIWLYVLGAAVNAFLAVNSYLEFSEVNRMALTMCALFVVCGVARTIVGRGE